MGTYIIRRLILAVLVLLIISFLVFIAMRILPGDPILTMVSSIEVQSLNEEMMAKLRADYGLDKPLIVQYFNWAEGIFHGDLGNSIQDQKPVTIEIMRRIPITIHIGLTAFVIGVILGIAAGVLCAIRRGTFIDTLVTALANLGITVPTFWLGIMLIYLFGLNLRWLPVEGYTSPFVNFWLSTKQLILPIACMVLFPLAANARQARSSMLEVMRQDYIRTAWSKGLKERVIIARHALKNGLIPVITLAGMGLSYVIGGTVVIEQVFNIPGMGRLAVTAALNQDYPYVQAVVLITATSIMMINLLVDIAYGWLDPRIRYS